MRTGVISPDGSLFADQFVRPLDPDATTPVDQVVSEHYGPDFAPDILGEIQLHDTGTGDVVASLPGMCQHGFGQGPDCEVFPDTPWPDYILNMAISADGSLLATAGHNSDGVRVLLLLTIDNEKLLDLARSRVTRGFSDTECSTYQIDPCPTLEEIRGG